MLPVPVTTPTLGSTLHNHDNNRHCASQYNNHSKGTLINHNNIQDTLYNYNRTNYRVPILQLHTKPCQYSSTLNLKREACLTLLQHQSRYITLHITIYLTNLADISHSTTTLYNTPDTLHNTNINIMVHKTNNNIRVHYTTPTT